VTNAPTIGKCPAVAQFKMTSKTIGEKNAVILEAIVVLVVLVLLYCSIAPMQSMAIIGQKGGVLGRYFHPI
jgi:hypothetical protein